MARYARAAAEPIRYGIRWGRAGAVAGVSLGLLGSMTALVTTNALAAYVTVSSQSKPSEFNTSKLTGQDVAFGMVQSDVNGTIKPVLRAGFASATLDGFCVSKTENVLGLFDVTLKVTSGNGAAGDDIVASNASFDLTELRGTTINLEGKDQVGQATADMTTTKTGGTFDTNPLGAPTGGYGAGWVGIDASKGTLSGLKGKLYSVEIQGDITLPNLSIGVTGASGFACNTVAGTTN
ncbi:DUF6230 family protein [Nocardioides sp. Kera G14]|uniref:DUF6230 family protein n=1 Tax=Nocardioides sp. Kera G14 TaxID=2884264 RepID=UPI001D115B74|nr:DUF6230 family protein [Nocardioides sp. Kera G14]UDY23205.1 DUF6230 family protein [Nocardioides sp. Kera G14]